MAPIVKTNPDGFPLDMAAHYLRCLEPCKKLRAQFELSFAYSPKYDIFVKKCGFVTFRIASFNSEEISAAGSSFGFSWLNFGTIELHFHNSSLCYLVFPLMLDFRFVEICFIFF